MTGGWSEVDGVAAAAAAFGTLVLAGVTGWLAKRTHDLAENADAQIRKAAEQVDASRQEVEATEALATEQRTDRQLQWRPQLERIAFGTVAVTNPESQEAATIHVRNSGAGPALAVVVLAREMDTSRWWIFPIGDLRPGEEKERCESRWANGNSLTEPFNDFPDCDDRRVVNFVMFCSDVLGRRFRFGVGEPKHPFPGERAKILAAQVSALTDAHPSHTGWAALDLIWG